MMASLRSRLIAGLLVVTALGLLIAGGVTYAEQRSFLLDRVDQQTHAAVDPVSHALDDRGIGFAGPAAPPPGTGQPRPGDRPFRRDDLRPRHGRPGVFLPPGTYGERRDPSGRVLGHVTLSYGQRNAAVPQLPARLPLGQLVTVDSRGGDGVRYRALAVPDPDTGEITVVAVPLREVDQTLNRLLRVEGLVVAGVLAAVGLLAWLLVRVGLRPLDRIGDTAGAIAAGDLSRRVSPADPRTEVGRLGLALNAMLARLEEAFSQRRASEERLRRFLADASHELRTPLSSIRGYAELFRLGAAEDPADTAKAMERIEQEAARMGVLVEDLLTLARLDEVREPVRERVDVGELARDAVDDARVTAPDREISVHAAAGAVVLGDPHQLRAVLGNLLRNALVHTPAGTPVEVTVATLGSDVAIEVRDHGPGLPEGHRAALFERFWRAEAGRERGRAGAGLGLAIVAGIVEAHGGLVHAGDGEGGGAAFLVTLPSAAPAHTAPAPATA